MWLNRRGDIGFNRSRQAEIGQKQSLASCFYRPKAASEVPALFDSTNYADQLLDRHDMVQLTILGSHSPIL
ncbi:hypothetical protein KFF47_08965 [Pseudomonas fluorescens]|nr:hypothetical protein [Pseudomonas fluorescens]